MLANHIQTSLHLVKYRPDEVKALYDIIVECGQDMFLRFGLSHWHPPYPFDVMQRNAARMDVYGVHHGDELIGTFTTGAGDRKYNHELWSDDSMIPLYLYKLAIRPIYQGRGWGRWCIEQIENMATNRQYRAIRFDVIASHLGLRSFFKELEYSERGTRFVSDYYGVKWEVAFFEKVVSHSSISQIDQQASICG